MDEMLRQLDKLKKRIEKQYDVLRAWSWFQSKYEDIDSFIYVIADAVITGEGGEDIPEGVAEHLLEYTYDKIYGALDKLIEDYYGDRLARIMDAGLISSYEDLRGYDDIVDNALAIVRTTLEVSLQKRLGELEPAEFVEEYIRGDPRTGYSIYWAKILSLVEREIDSIVDEAVSTAMDNYGYLMEEDIESMEEELGEGEEEE